jgi:hypothetical protein
MPSIRTSRAVITALRSIAKDGKAKAEIRLEACRYLLILEGALEPSKVATSKATERLKALLDIPVRTPSQLTI